ncbi:HAD family hydrolase [Paenibacillus flagellatus]|uniref:Haloacid dehalogenase n=1 Tax=Paenibacillus flagellatus TaxID=2211139 RepID=A0A2V5KBZ2_9BACL|nr:HAD family hydrolase [Paenibacillus flagellatus]PYI57099.1 haloacid dehalogenase [Paenibacillus flagellatus]
MKRAIPEAMLFDLDGTLFQTETLLLPAYEAAFDELKREGTYTKGTPPKELILSSLGMLLEHIWARVLPDADEQVRRRADELLLHYQMEGLKRGDGRLYPGVEETLRALHAKGVKLFVASNGLEIYVKEVIRLKGLEPLFTGLYSAGEYRTRSKVDLVKLLVERHGLTSAWMVGDRSSDVEAGKGNGLPVVGCRYAQFGEESELEGADMIITEFGQLLELAE